MEHVIGPIVKKITEIIQEKHKSLTIKPNYIKDNIFVFINCIIENPSFSSQTKEKHITKVSGFGSKFSASDEFVKSVSKLGIIENVLALADAKEKKSLQKTIPTISADMERRFQIAFRLAHQAEKESDINNVEVIYDQTGVFNDYEFIAGGDKEFRRVLLRHSDVKDGAFSSLFGKSEIELVQVLNREQKVIYEDRIWGDPGFIHLCFDINDMDALRDKAKRLGFPFTVDSAKAMDTFDMGDAGGNFAYIQAPEGTLIEFVETHKIPLIKKIGWNIDFRKRGNHPLPRWILNLFKYKRVK